MNSSGADQELESFREQWRAEVRARQPTQASRLQSTVAGSSAQPSVAPPWPGRTTEPPQRAIQEKRPIPHDRDDDYVQARSFDEDAPTVSASEISEEIAPAQGTEPVTALEHYEKAVEKETIGNLGESLSLYRKAFRVCLVLGYRPTLLLGNEC